MFAAAALSCGICLLDGLVLSGCGGPSGKVVVGEDVCIGYYALVAQAETWASRTLVLSLQLLTQAPLQGFVFSLSPYTRRGGDILQQVPGERFSWRCSHQPVAACSLWTSSGWEIEVTQEAGWDHLLHLRCSINGDKPVLISK